MAQQLPVVLKHYAIRGLFGSRDISLAPASDGPTLLTGANGSGKSTVLKTLDAFSRGDWAYLRHLPFASLELKFGRRTVRMTHDDDRLVVQSSRSQPFVFPSPESPNMGFQTFLYTGEPPDFPRTDRFYRQLQRAYSDPAFFHPTNPEEAEAVELWQSQMTPSWLMKAREALPVRLIGDQRLLLPRNYDSASGTARTARRVEAGPRRQEGQRGGYPRTVSQFARELLVMSRRELSAYGVRSQTLDRAFPMKVVEAIASRSDEETMSDIAQLLEQVQQRQRALEDAGLLERSRRGTTLFDPQRLSDASAAKVVRVYAEDTLTKFGWLEPIRKKLAAFLGFLNSHYVGKHVSLDPERGLSIRLSDRIEISPAQLSSGEQQIMVLAYQVIFQTAPKTLILIDEPEISLHVLWLNTLVDDLHEMGMASGLQFILATHSPTLIGAREQLVRPLS